MIVDTSALVAISYGEEGAEPLLQCVQGETGILPAPVLVEYRLVVSLEGNTPDPDAELLLKDLLSHGLTVEPFTAADSNAAFAAIERYGRGNGRGGKLNLLDLTVYGMAKRMSLPVLCTGRDFPSTDIAIHPASRRW